MSQPLCPSCSSEYVYPDQNQLICPECGYEWDPQQAIQDAIINVNDVNGTRLSVGDKLIIAKDLKIKGSSKVLKIGTKAVVKHIIEGKDHQLDCRVDGAGEMMITAKFVKKS